MTRLRRVSIGYNLMIAVMIVVTVGQVVTYLVIVTTVDPARLDPARLHEARLDLIGDVYRYGMLVLGFVLYRIRLKARATGDVEPKAMPLIVYIIVVFCVASGVRQFIDRGYLGDGTGIATYSVLLLAAAVSAGSLWWLRRSTLTVPD